MKRRVLMATASIKCLGRMTPAERAMGRYMRSPDDHPAAPAEPVADAPAAPVADAAPAEPVADAAPADDTTILGAPAADPVADPAADPAAAEADPADPDAPPVEAAAYADLTPPEGFEALDADALTAATPLMRKFGVADDQAQDFINEAAPVIKGMVEKALAGAAAQQAEAQATIRTEWANELKADKDFGGAHYEKTVARAALALDKFFDPETRNFLNVTGLGNKPELVKGFAKIGEHFADGEIITGEPIAAPKGHPLYDDAFLPPEQRRG